MSNIDLLIEDYINHLRFEKGYQKNTLESYKLDLKKFKIFLEKENISDIKFVSSDTVRGFIKFCYSQGISQNSVARYISSIKGFFKFLEKEGIIDGGFIDKIERPKVSRTLPNYMDTQEIESLLKKALQKAQKYKSGIREYAILELLYSTGLRISELINLKLENVNLEEEFIKVFGKGGKERIIPINKKAVEALRMYLEKRQEYLRGNPDNGFLFVSNRGKKFSRVGMWKLIKKYVLQLNTPKKITPHTFRHTFATHLIKRGADIRIVQEFLGHKNISTTQIYTHISKEHLKKAYEQFHPLENNPSNT